MYWTYVLYDISDQTYFYREVGLELNGVNARLVVSPPSLPPSHPPTPPQVARSHDFTLPRQVSGRLAPLLLSFVVFLLPRWSDHPPLLSRVVWDLEAIRFVLAQPWALKRTLCWRTHDSDVRSLRTTNVEGPIECHNSRLASREPDDGLTGTYSGGSLDRTETVPTWSRERRARPGLKEASRRDKIIRSWSHKPLNLSGNAVDVLDYNHIYVHIRTICSDRVARGDLYVTSIPNQSFLQYTWYLVNLNSRFFSQPRQQLIL